jgi:hypothetical protein
MNIRLSKGIQENILLLKKKLRSSSVSKKMRRAANGDSNKKYL